MTQNMPEDGAEIPGTPQPMSPPGSTPENTPATWPSTPQSTPQSPPQYSPQATTPPPPGAYPAQVVPTAGTSTNAIVAFVLAVLSWVICPLIPAIVALVFASMGAKEIAATGGRMDGRGLVTAARIVAWVNVGVFAAVVVGIAFFGLIALLLGSA